MLLSKGFHYILSNFTLFEKKNKVDANGKCCGVSVKMYILV